MRKANVSDDTFAKESRFLNAGPGAIEKLIGNHHVERGIPFLQRTHGRSREQTFYAQQFHAVDICPVRNFRGCEAMTTSMAREKGYALIFQGSHNESVRRIAKRRFDFHLFDVPKFGHLVEATAANNSDARVVHFDSFCSLQLLAATYADNEPAARLRSEERRVGKECRLRWSAYRLKQKNRVKGVS